MWYSTKQYMKIQWRTFSSYLFRHLWDLGTLAFVFLLSTTSPVRFFYQLLLRHLSWCSSGLTHTRTENLPYSKVTNNIYFYHVLAYYLPRFLQRWLWENQKRYYSREMIDGWWCWLHGNFQGFFFSNFIIDKSNCGERLQARVKGPNLHHGASLRLWLWPHK